jgi:hypothetical protein
MSSCRSVVLAIAVLSGVSACYEYVPVDSPAETVGKVVELKINDPGRVGLADRFGPGLDRVEGRLVAQRDNELTLSVTNVSMLDGVNTKWSGESVNLNRGFVGRLSSRKISTVKTTLFAAVAGAAVYFMAARALNSSGRESDDTQAPPTTPISRRIPIGIRIRANP